MNLYPEIKIIVITCLLLAGILFIVKVLLAEYLRRSKAGYFEPKLAWWYNQHQVNIPDIKLKLLMRWSNVLTSAMWLFILIAIVLAWGAAKLH